MAHFDSSEDFSFLIFHFVYYMLVLWRLYRQISRQQICETLRHTWRLFSVDTDCLPLHPLPKCNNMLWIILFWLIEKTNNADRRKQWWWYSAICWYSNQITWRLLDKSLTNTRQQGNMMNLGVALWVLLSK